MKSTRLRLSALLLVFALLATQVAVFSAFAEEGGEGDYYCNVCGDHAVPDAESRTISATCAENGYVIYSCKYEKEVSGGTEKCTGEIVYAVIPATGAHVSDGKTVAGKEATCTADGITEHTHCVTCGCMLNTDGSVLEDEVIHSSGHQWDAGAVTAPTCTEEGYTLYTCTVCKEATKKEAVTSASGHDYSTAVVAQAPTCVSIGWEAYHACSRCGEKGPDYKEIPKLEHNCIEVERAEPTCTTDGYIKFVCSGEGCPFNEGVTETLPALGHTLVKHDKVEASCEKDGMEAYSYCDTCKKNFTADKEGKLTETTLEALVIPKLEHNLVTLGRVEPTCTENGSENQIVCTRCAYISYQGEVIPAKGHTLESVEAKAPTCTTNGNIAHKTCTVCNKLYDIKSESNDPSAVEVSAADVTLDKLGHECVEWYYQPETCTEEGYKIYTCNRDGCGYTYSELIDAKGHNLASVAEVKPTCTSDGKKAHEKCSTCGELFVNGEAVEETELTVKALGHKSVEIEMLAPTYDAPGHSAGTICERCNTFLTAEALDELSETVRFHMEVTGVNGADEAVNSGYVTLKIYFDVIADETNDKAEYNSDVLANIYGINLGLVYDNESFELTDVTVAPGLFAKASFTEYEMANEDGTIRIAQEMGGNSAKVFRGEDNLFATLTFMVDKDAEAVSETFALNECAIAHPEENAADGDEVTVVKENETTVSSVEIEVLNLGDANGDGKHDIHDSLVLRDYIMNAELDTEYMTVYDMDKDGDIDFIDLDLLRQAIVGNCEYLTITVDPNAPAAEAA